MADIDLKTETPDTSLPSTGFLFGADSQAAASPSVFTVQSVATTLLGSTTLTGATVTTSSPIIDASQTWNASGVTFTGLKFNATDTASAAGSLLMDLQVGGTSQFSITKAGTGFVNGAAAIAGAQFSGNGTAELFGTSALLKASSRWPGGSGVGGRVFLAVFTGAGTNHIAVPSDAQFSWSSSALSTLTSGAGSDVNSVRDLFLTRRAAANLRLGAADAAAPVAQTLSVQSVVAGTSNTAGANLTITGSQGTGTGAGGSIIFQVAPAGSSGTAQNALATALTIAASKVITVADTYDLAFGTTTGTKIGTATTQKIGFFNAAPVVQPTAVADATDAATVITQLNALLSRMRDLGLIAT